MTDQQQNITTSEIIGQDVNKPMGLRDFVLRYLKYFPWVIISIALALIIAYVKLRYEIPIYRVQSSLLIKNDRSNSGDKDDKLDELFLAQSTVNLSNEIEILKSTPLMERVVRDLGIQTSYYNKGNLRSTLLYDECPFKLRILQHADSTVPLSFTLVYVNDEQFTINKSTAIHYFGQPFKIGNNEFVLDKNSYIGFKSFQSKEFIVSWTPLFGAAQNI